MKPRRLRGPRGDEAWHRKRYADRSLSLSLSTSGVIAYFPFPFWFLLVPNILQCSILLYPVSDSTLFLHDGVGGRAITLSRCQVDSGAVARRQPSVTDKPG